MWARISRSRAVSTDNAVRFRSGCCLTSSSTTLGSITEPLCATVLIAAARSSALATRSFSRYARPAEPCSRSASA